MCKLQVGAAGALGMEILISHYSPMKICELVHNT